MRQSTARSSLSILFLVCMAAASVSSVAAQECPVSGDLELPDGQDRWDCTITGFIGWLQSPGIDPDARLGRKRGGTLGAPTGDGYFRYGLPVTVSGSGPIEVIIKLRETTNDDVPGGYELGIAEEESPRAPNRVGTLYRALLYDPDHYEIGLHYFVRGSTPEDVMAYEKDHDFDLRILLRRVPRYCSMWARVSGDVNGAFYGDVAYYNFAVDGVLVDKEMLRALGQLGITTDSEGEDSFAAFLQREMGGTDNFALSLRDFKVDQEFDTVSSSADPGVELFGFGDEKNQDVLRQVAGMLNGQFALGLSGVVTESTDKEGKVTRSAQISDLRATVGAVAGGDRIPFELIPGKSSATLTLLEHPSPDLVWGTFVGDLYTDGEYTLPNVPDPRQLHVHVEANFTALEGQVTCVKR